MRKNPKNTTATAAHAHPVVLIARALGVIVGVLLLMSRVPMLWPLVGGLAAYAVALLALRRDWPGPDGHQAAPPART